MGIDDDIVADVQAQPGVLAWRFGGEEGIDDAGLNVIFAWGGPPGWR